MRLLCDALFPTRHQLNLPLAGASVSAAVRALLCGLSASPGTASTSIFTKSPDRLFGPRLARTTTAAPVWWFARRVIHKPHSPV